MARIPILVCAADVINPGKFSYVCGVGYPIPDGVLCNSAKVENSQGTSAGAAILDEFSVHSFFIGIYFIRISRLKFAKF